MWDYTGTGANANARRMRAAVRTRRRGALVAEKMARESVKVGAIVVERFTLDGGTGPVLRGRFTIERDGSDLIAKSAPAFTVERKSGRKIVESDPIIGGRRTLAADVATRVASAFGSDTVSGLAGVPAWSAFATALAGLPAGTIAEVRFPGDAVESPDAVVAALAALRVEREKSAKSA